MPIDPQAQAVLDQAATLNLPPLNTLTPDQARANAKARPAATGPDVAAVEDRLIPGPDSDLPVRIYTPSGPGPFPALVWFHGGGWVVGDLDMTDGTCRHLASGAGCVVVSVDYRLAPEAKFPSPAEDCLAATQWVANNGGSLRVDAGRIAVGGSSAGANLAAAVTLMARDRGGPPLAFQLLVVPVTDRDFTTTSYRDNENGYGITRDAMMWYWNHYLAHDEDARNPYAAPLRTADLAGLPPALVITAEFDPLRDEGEAYGHRLAEAGVPTTYTCYDGMIHGFFGQGDQMDKGREAVSQATGALRAAFAR